MINIQNLTKIYPGNVQALREITFEIGPGLFGLVGPNGAGKTSLLRILAGLSQPSAGQVHIWGHDVTTPTGRVAIKAQLGYLPQELGLYPQLTATEFLDYIARLKGVADQRTRQRQVAEALAQVRLSEVADRHLKTYSGGMKRRVGIAQALLGHPRLVIVDEPTVGLDPEERVRLRNLLSELATHCTVLLSTHIIEDISQSCQTLAVIARGQVCFHGSPATLTAEVQGQVWLVNTTGKRPIGDVHVVSSVQTPQGMQFRVLGQPAPPTRARLVEPTLEDGYMWLMAQTSAASTSAQAKI